MPIQFLVLGGGSGYFGFFLRGGGSADFILGCTEKEGHATTRKFKNWVSWKACRRDCIQEDSKKGSQRASCSGF